MPRDAVSRTAHIGTVGTNGLTQNVVIDEKPPFKYGQIRLGACSSCLHFPGNSL